MQNVEEETEDTLVWTKACFGGNVDGAGVKREREREIGVTTTARGAAKETEQKERIEISQKETINVPCTLRNIRERKKEKKEAQ